MLLISCIFVLTNTYLKKKKKRCTFIFIFDLSTLVSISSIDIYHHGTVCVQLRQFSHRENRKVKVYGKNEITFRPVPRRDLSLANGGG